MQFGGSSYVAIAPVPAFCVSGPKDEEPCGAKKGHGPPNDLYWSLLSSAGAQGEQGLPGDASLAGQSCPDGESVTGFDQSGTIVCT